MLCVGISGGFNFIHENIYRFGYGFSHDGAAALVDNGMVVAAIEEERLNRIKHSNKFPEHALRFCLKTHGVTAEDIACFAFYLREDCCDNILSRSFLYHEHDQTSPLRNTRSLLRDRLQETLQRDIAPERIAFVPHHMAHAASAFALSGFDSSLVFAVDGIGDYLSGLVATGDAGALVELKRYHMKKSLGALYFSITRLLGYTYFDEYKVMGLAPYGNPARYRDAISALYELLPNGDYELRLDGVASALVSKIKPRRMGDPIEQEHKDLAASLQEGLETVAFHILKYFSRFTSQRTLCLAGGVAQNCTMNGKILYSDMFDRVFVQPASHDAGCAVGAALASINGHGTPGVRNQLRHVYWGTDIGDNEDIARELRTWKTFIEYEQMEDITGTSAELLAKGGVIAWVQGRSEFGPRALGNRSILADPRPAENKDRINKLIKKREAFRPFAPSIVAEEADDYFELPPNRGSYSFMSFVVNVREDKRRLLGAVTHIDGTARVQTVEKDSNPRFWLLLRRFKELTGIPCLLNTSYNNNSEPIANSTLDAITTFLTTDLDYVVINDFLIKKRLVDWRNWTELSVSLPRYVQIVHTTSFNRAGKISGMAELRNTYDEGFRLPISDGVYSVLSEVGNTPTIGCSIARADSEESARALVCELLRLWERRLIVLSPQCSDGNVNT